MGKAILFIDGDKHWREQARNCFSAAGQKLVEAANAEEALQRSEFEPLSVIIMDLELQGEKTFTLLQFLKANNPDIPILIFTATPQDDPEVIKILAQGGCDYVRKDSIEELLVAAGTHLTAQ